VINLRRYLPMGLVLCLCGCARERSTHVGEPPPRSGTRTTRSAPGVGDGGAGCSDEDRDRSARQVLRGFASYYANSLAGNPTASGAPYEPRLYTAAHRTLPFGTRLRVTRTDTNQAPVCVTVNDRGPFAGRRRIVDLSRRAAEALEMIGEGVVPVRVDVL
jgi:rare lipoprotein A (peptidoglycan hydrolase)